MSLFKVGDEVGSVRSNGVVTGIGKYECFPVRVSFENGEADVFSEDGMENNQNIHPSIWHKGTGSAPVVGKRPIRYPIYKEDIFIDGSSIGFKVRLDELNSGSAVESDHYAFKAGFKLGGIASHNDSRCCEECDEPTAPIVSDNVKELRAAFEALLDYIGKLK